MRGNPPDVFVNSRRYTRRTRLFIQLIATLTLGFVYAARP